MIVGHRLLGNGPHRAIVLHGWFGDENILDPAVPALSEDFTFCCIAYRGYGASRALTGVFNLDEIAGDAIDVADFLGWERFAVVGHSMGGKAAQKIMLRAPKRVTRIVAITPVPASRVAFDSAGWELFNSAADDGDKRQAIIDFSTGGRLPRTWCSRLAARSLANSTREAFAAYLKAWALEDFSEQVAGSKTPLLTLVGRHDPQLTEAAMRATYLQWFDDAVLEIIENAGHYPIDETPIALAMRLEQFLLRE